MSGGSIFVYIHRPIHSIQPVSSSSVSQSSITPAPKPAKLKNMKIQTKPNYCKNLIRHDHRPIIRMIHLGKDAAGQFLAKTLSWANYQRARVPGTFCSQGPLSHRDLIPQYLNQNLLVNTSSAACPVHGNRWKSDHHQQQRSESGSDRIFLIIST